MRWLHSLTFLFTVLLFAACGPRNARVAPALPTNTPVPTFTATPVGAAPAASSSQTGSQTQVQPAATSAPPGATAAPELPMVTIGNVLMNVRGGPGTNYHVIGTASPGQRFAITGKNPVLGDWWQIDYNGETGWVYGPLVTATNANSVQVALVIPAPPPPTATPTPPPAVPTAVPAPTQPLAPRYAFRIAHQGDCHPNKKSTFFDGFINDRGGNLKNDVCVHFAFNGPRQTVCSGCPSLSGAHGKWGFNPFGLAPEGETMTKSVGVNFEIYVVNCPVNLQASGRPENVFTSNDWSNVTPLSEKWTRTFSESTACSKITFQEN